MTRQRRACSRGRRVGLDALACLVAGALLVVACNGSSSVDEAVPATSAAASASEALDAWATATGGAPGWILGHVFDGASQAPIAGATIASGDRSATSDAAGRFALRLPLGHRDLTVTAEGFSPASRVAVVAGLEPATVSVALPPLDPGPVERQRFATRLVAAGRGEGGANVASAQTRLEPPMHVAAVTEVPPTIRVLMPEGDIREMDLETYLRGVVPSEMGYLFRRDMDALKAQAIAARTYAVTSCLPDSAGDPEQCEPGIDANVDTSTRTQVWRPVTYEVSDAAVAATRGQVARHHGALIHALYFARTRDRTLSSEESPCCSGRSVAYLRSVTSPDPFAERRGHGAGMSQEGAAVLGDWGAVAEEIVSHYYTGVTVDPPAPEPEATTEVASLGTPGAPPGVRAGTAELTADVMTIASDAEHTAGADAAVVASSAIEASFPFMALGVRWVGDPDLVDDVSIEARTSQDGLAWGAWTALRREEDLKTRDPAGELWTQLWIARGRQLQVRVAGPPGVAPTALLERVTVHYLDADRGPAAPDLPAQAIDVPIVPRAAWGADERLRYDGSGAEIWPAEYTAPRAQIVHHTVTGNDPADPAAVVRSIYHYHAVSRGWGDIGYHFLLDHRGNVYEGRYGGERGGRIVQGGHALQFNANTIGVALLGTFTEAPSRPSAAAEAALTRLLASKGLRFGIDPLTPVSLAGSSFPYGVLGHRDVLPGHTQCPGDGVAARMPAIRQAVSWLMAQQDVTATPPPATATSRPPTATSRPPTATVRPSTPTPRPTPLPTATVPTGCRQWVRDGGFEGTAAAWMLSRAAITRWDVYRGEQALFVGLRDDEPDTGTTYASAMQSIVIDEAVGSATLTFFARTQGDEGDRRLVRLLDENGAVIALADATLPATSAWNAYRFDVTQALAGQVGREVRLYIGVINNGDGSRSFARIDEMSLLACPAGVVTAAATATTVPSPTPTPRGGTVVCAPVVRDGAFAADGKDGWRFTGEPPGAALVGPAETSLLLGQADPSADRFGYSAAALGLELPQGVLTATLRLRIQAVVVSPEDAFVVEARRNSDGARLRLLGPQALPPPGAWSEREVVWDATALSRDVELYLAVLNRGQTGPGGVTAVLVDDLEVSACAPRSAASRFLPWGGTAGP